MEDSVTALRHVVRFNCQMNKMTSKANVTTSINHEVINYLNIHK